MKKLFLSVLLCLMTCAVFAEVPKNWTLDLDAAKATAAKENKHVFVLFTGSDWCGWCKKLKKDVFDKSRFKKFAKKELVLVYLDFPRNPTTSAEQQAKQRKWQQELGPVRGFPTAVILDSKGAVCGRLSGGGLSESKYIKSIKKMIK